MCSAVGVCFEIDPLVEVELGSGARFFPALRLRLRLYWTIASSNFQSNCNAYHWLRVVLHTCCRQEQGKNSSALSMLRFSTPKHSSQELRTASASRTSRKAHCTNLRNPNSLCAESRQRTPRVLKNLLHFHFTIFPFEFITITCNDYQ
jgi:hypothetical protein